MRRKGPFIRDVELHGHHSECLARFNGMDEHPAPCVCRELDHDDWIAAGEAEMDRRREEPRERMEHDE